MQCAIMETLGCMVGGTHPAEGRLELCFRGVWGTVCRDNWGTEAALVACRQLGFVNIGKYFHILHVNTKN